MVNVMIMFAGLQDHQEKAKYFLIINHGFRFDQLLIFFLIILSSLWSCHVVAAADNIGDTLKIGDTLNSSSALVSASGKFTLLFLPNSSSSNYSYLYIRRYNVTSANKGWVGNRDSPVLYPFGVLTLDSNNTLKIITTQGGPGGGDDDPLVVLGSAPKSSSNVAATLSDSGNFILQELNSDGSTKQVWWQSFDYPADTFLPGMKLGVNRSNGHIWSVTSWTSVNYPPPGPFILDWDPTARQLEIRREGVVCWRSGNYSATNNRFQNILPNAKVSYKFSIVSNENEDYLTYTSEDGAYELPEWILNYYGKLFNYYGLGIDIARADQCGGYNTDGVGCQTTGRPTTCMADFGSPFVLKKGYFKPITSSSASRCPYSLNFVSNGSYSGTSIDCNNTCLQNCDCLGLDFQFDNQTGCRFWSVDCEFVEDLTRPDNSSSLVLAKLPPSKSGATHKWIWIGVAISAALVIMAFSILCYLRRRRRRQSKLSGEGKIDQNELLNFRSSKRPTDLNGLQNDGKMGRDLSVFSYASVMAATINFAEENKLGEGGFGPVYKGKLATGEEVAVKRLSKCSGQGTLEFKNELILIYELQHTNLVQLFGFCIHGEERMLIYEYMPNKSLDYFLFDSVRGVFLDWSKRFSIIEGIAQGLLYLHKFSRTRVIHRDLKASNVLLDENMNPKISDFGMARIFSINELEANTSRIVGTRGYMPPEYAMEGIFSTKSDVYSFGVLVLEIISGRKNNSFYNDDRAINLVGYAWELWKEGAGLQLMDPALADSCTNKDQLLRCVQVGLLCVEDSAGNRPTMSDVLSGLTNESSPLPAPTKPAFSTDRHAVTSTIAEKEPQILSVNDLTISACDGR
ncbi:G-type lectin S-receptor-like serine/threonine-protein kinase At1g67520 isoform X1 [Rosa rugosa]|uniref:G-type lectin S-receptor-like serine/threonine-protein kinase At1g67520 isoform X1 n=2 Tax=Rosa rugosa TaxID=74645 RepID=UPI002B41112D|nr:G-type lectin S-receptor-like serine/threonine-protein kinase At1g67520 isoform X1 [Rosa rugosa]